MHLYTMTIQLSPGHTLYSYGVPDSFGNLQRIEFNQALYHEYSNQHDDHALRSFQLPHPYRLPRGVAVDDGPGLP